VSVFFWRRRLLDKIVACLQGLFEIFLLFGELFRKGVSLSF